MYPFAIALTDDQTELLATELRAFANLAPSAPKPDEFEPRGSSETYNRLADVVERDHELRFVDQDEHEAAGLLYWAYKATAGAAPEVLRPVFDQVMIPA